MPFLLGSTLSQNVTTRHCVLCNFSTDGIWSRFDIQQRRCYLFLLGYLSRARNCRSFSFQSRVWSSRCFARNGRLTFLSSTFDHFISIFSRVASLGKIIYLLGSAREIPPQFYFCSRLCSVSSSVIICLALPGTSYSAHTSHASSHDPS
ncbi:hypothetical protein MLD38_036400 [Melastoma candidum]|uniref:Uncharacterized protein n=1 Tax=Melastoma candidum TaxID=119954 RepID=A0ACB9LJS3_9MYRT|nr:hypothetical protein MLD38_036400 [Melastoma candidum]